jgi:hypothetical protein
MCRGGNRGGVGKCIFIYGFSESECLCKELVWEVWKSRLKSLHGKGVVI